MERPGHPRQISSKETAMRIDRWFWLPVFCVVSLIMHFTVVIVTRGMGLGGDIRRPEAPSIEVTFEPSVTPPVKKEITPPEPRRKREAKTPRLVAHTPANPVVAPTRPAVSHP